MGLDGVKVKEGESKVELTLNLVGSEQGHRSEKGVRDDVGAKLWHPLETLYVSGVGKSQVENDGETGSSTHSVLESLDSFTSF